MAVKSLLRYLRGTMNLALCYQGGSFQVEGYSDAEGSADKDGRKEWQPCYHSRSRLSHMHA